MEEAKVLRIALESLQQQLSMLQKTLERLTEQNREMAEQNRQKDERIEELTQMLLNMQRARFGQRSEKSVYVLDDGTRQLSIFDPPQGESTKVATENADNQSQEPPLTGVAAGEDASGDTGEIVVSGHKRKKKRTLEELCANLPVEEHVVDIPEAEQVSETGSPLVCIGREYIRTELVMERAKLKVVKHYRKVYANREWEMEYGDADLYKPDMPGPLLKHSYVSPSVATDVMVKKYADGLPLYRQEQQWKRLGVPLKRGTMANWMIQLSGRYFARFRDRLREELVKQAVIHADETVLQVLKEPGKDPASESRMWVYASSKGADKQIRLFDYRDSRKGECAKDFLKDFHGILVTDGYSGYNKVPEVTRAGCWAHMRRKWHEAMPKGEAGQKSLAAQGYRFCNRLFALERKLEDLKDKERRLQRQKQAKPILDAYWAWVDSIRLPSGKLKDAVTYALNQKEYLCTFLDHGEVEISNNQVENAIRPFVVGRKGWLFSDTPEGAEASAVIYSLMETAKANGLRLEDYILHLLSILPERFEADPNADIDDLLPWNDAVKACFVTL